MNILKTAAHHQFDLVVDDKQITIELPNREALVAVIRTKAWWYRMPNGKLRMISRETAESLLTSYLYV